jgi:IS30 family transposase
MSNIKMFDQKHLSTTQRIKIEKGLNDGLSFAAIARTIDKHPSTVAKEVKKYRYFPPKENQEKPLAFYSAQHADQSSQELLVSCRTGINQDPVDIALLDEHGAEFQFPTRLECYKTGEICTKVYYCNPNSSWQKGMLEKNHEYIRYVIPKGISLDPFTQGDAIKLMNHINSEAKSFLC